MKKTVATLITLVSFSFLLASSGSPALQLTDSQLLAVTGGGKACLKCSEGQIVLDVQTGIATCESGSLQVTTGDECN